MITTRDLSSLKWTVSGYTPHVWRFAQTMELGLSPIAEIAPIAARIPGSVQGALRKAGLLPDWNVGLKSRECEWVENRHWMFEAALPDEWFGGGQKVHRLHCQGLDGNGAVLVNNQTAGTFDNAFLPQTIDIAPYLKDKGNMLQIVFECAPRWLGQMGFTSQFTQWKPRFNYTWDWIPRLVQIGIWDNIFIQSDSGLALDDICITTEVAWPEKTGILRVRGEVRGEFDRSHKIRVVIEQDGKVIGLHAHDPRDLKSGIELKKLDVLLWSSHDRGKQRLYSVRIQLLHSGRVLDEVTRRVGFKHIAWQPCVEAPPEADPWLCVLNGDPIFLQGVNWTPIRPFFADVTVSDYRRRLELYKDLGCNILRVWGGAFLEKECFYELCDELGIMVWQEFPLSSSGLDNWPPEDDESVETFAKIARSYIERRGHHASLLMWCGGNELQGALDGGKTGIGKPVDNSHPLIARLKQVVEELDRTHRFVPTSSSGPRFMAEEKDYGKGLHWDVHGPWNVDGNKQDWQDDWERYWVNDDSLFRSETGCPGSNGAEMIRTYAGDQAPMPGTLDNPLWRRSSWWIDWPQFVAEFGRQPRELSEYCAWSQERQKLALVTAAGETKKRFPRCGGFIVWMGHDCFPCPSNTSIVDYDGYPKPAGLGLGQIFQISPESLRKESE